MKNIFLTIPKKFPNFGLNPRRVVGIVGIPWYLCEFVGICVGTFFFQFQEGADYCNTWNTSAWSHDSLKKKLIIPTLEIPAPEITTALRRRRRRSWLFQHLKYQRLKSRQPLEEADYSNTWNTSTWNHDSLKKKKQKLILPTLGIPAPEITTALRRSWLFQHLKYQHLKSRQPLEEADSSNTWNTSTWNHDSLKKKKQKLIFPTLEIPAPEITTALRRSWLFQHLIYQRLKSRQP